jgi:CBS domain-containing protein
MPDKKVKDIMVPLAEYATVSENANLYDAVLALREAQQKFHQGKDPHRAILVLNDQGNVVGKLSQWDLIKGLEPNYDKIGDFKETSRFGFSPDFLKSLMSKYALWNHPLMDLCRKAAQKKVKDIMYTPTQGEFVREDALLDEAIHQLIVGRHQSLLVTKDKKIAGILRLSDVFREVCDLILACPV